MDLSSFDDVLGGRDSGLTPSASIETANMDREVFLLK